MSEHVWRHIDEKDVSASHGLASDEYLMHTHSSKTNPYPASLKLYSYRNHCALCGRFQDLMAEIDIAACKENGVEVGRRLTGGGAIIMGENQLGICLTSHSSLFEWTHIRELYHLFSQPIIQALKAYSIDASFRSKNDIEVNGKKIAGLGIHISPDGSMQFHSSLLLDLDIPQMLKVLKIPIQKFSDKKMVHTIEQRMTTVRTETQQMVSMIELKKTILNAYAKQFDVAFQNTSFSEEELGQIESLQRERYQTDEWLFQNSPQQDMDGVSLKKTAAGLLRTYIGMKGENIKSVLITGDFMDMPEAFSQIEAQLKWSPLDKDKISDVVYRVFNASSETTSHVVVKPEEVVEAIWLAAQRAFAAKKYTYKGSCYYPTKETADA